ncbi:hypothetical protein [Bradyrhizobium glycinis]|uniref:hypothetical protein n=1 Tax=Bradyrhizobium glycinis TaxID=2751812 RepID=UPI0018D74A53|nr:hypothetical protein [Bradyrhizobium glycinis]MBH5372814.1 hypothetical protein [Bradyrhizobium glycinis]
MAEQDEKTGQFLPGNKGNGGRRKGARNRLHADFVVALQEHFTEFGKAAIDIVFKESPKDYLKIITAVLPKEFILEDGRLDAMGDEEIAEYLAEIRRLKAEQIGSGADGGAKATLN